MSKTIRPAPDGSGTYAELDGAEFTDTIKAPEVISPKFSATDDSIYRFTVQDAFTFNAALRTSIPTDAYTSDKGSAYWTFTRTGAGTFEDVDGTVQTASADHVPRFGGTNYDPVTGEHSQVDSNGAIIPTSPAFESGIWAVGDSITDAIQSWVFPLETMLSQRINKDYAVAGEYLNKNSPEVAVTVDIYENYLSAVPSMSNPSVIVLQGGMNDLFTIGGTQTEADVLPGMITNMSLMIDDAVARATTVYVFGIHGFGAKAGASTATQNASRVKFNTWLKSYCDITGAVFLDINSVLESPTTAGQISDRLTVGDLQTYTNPQTSPDGVHINTLGARMVSEFIFRAMDRKYIKGLLLETSATENLALYSQKFDEAATWVPTTMTAAAEITIPDPSGGTETYSLEATGANGTVIQTITSAESPKCISVWMKRKTGTGRIFMAYDGGTLLAPIQIDDSWQRVYLNGGYDVYSATPIAADEHAIMYEPVTNPAVTIQIETSGDAVYVWGAQVEERSFPSSYVATGAATATRGLEVFTLTRTLLNAFARDTGTIALTLTPEWGAEEMKNDGGTAYIVSDTAGSSSMRLYFFARAINALRNTGASIATTIAVFSSFPTYGRPNPNTYGQEIGGIMRGQVVPLSFTWSWETGTAMEVDGYSCGGSGTVLSANTDQPQAISSTTTYFGISFANTRPLYGYIRDVYFSISALPASTLDPLADLVNRW